MAELTKRLSRAEEALKKTRVARDASLRANEELGQAMVKKDAEIKKIRMELMKAQGFVTEYLINEEELIREIAKEKDTNHVLLRSTQLPEYIVCV